METQATSEVKNLFRADPADQTGLKQLMKEYTAAASELADDYYNTCRQLWRQEGGVDMPDYDHRKRVAYNRVLFESTDRPEDRGRNYAQTAYEIDQDPAASFDDLYPDDLMQQDTASTLLHDMLENAARLQTQQNMSSDPRTPQYARLPRGLVTCAFCTMLAGRGFAYWTQESAGGLSGYHKHCDCQIICRWKDRGYERVFAKYQQMYEQARGATAHPENYHELLKVMRRQNPGKLGDGVTLKPDMKQVNRILDKAVKTGQIVYNKPRNSFVKKEEINELYAHAMLVKNGYKVTVRAETAPVGKSNIDLLVNGQLAEVKSPVARGEGSHPLRFIDDNLRHAHHQFAKADVAASETCVVFNGAFTPVDDALISKTIKQRAPERGIDEVIQILKNGGIQVHKS